MLRAVLIAHVSLAWFALTSSSAFAQEMLAPSSTASVEELAEQLRITQSQLQDTQRQLEGLLRQDARHDSSLESEYSGQQNSQHAVTPASHAAASTCGKCGKTVGHAVPHVCGICLENLSWNKAGGWKIVPFGMLRGELIYSQQEQVADALIFFLAPDSPGVDEDQFTAHAKTSMLNFAFTGPDIGPWQTGGAIVMNFTGAQPLRNFSGPNILNAYGELKNDNWRFAFGRMFDLFSPITTQTVNMGQQRAAGNVGIFRGAVQLDRYLTISENRKITLSGRLSQPVAKDFLLLPTARGIDNGFPNLEGRIGFGFGSESDGQRPFEIGLSGLWGETRAIDAARIVTGPVDQFFVLPAATNVSTTAGGCLDVQLRGERFGLNGEFWMAQAAGTYFVAVLQTLNPATGEGIRSIGGWVEGYCKLNERTTTYLGYGLDDPRNQDVGFLTAPVDPNDPGQRLYNQVAWTNVKFDVTNDFQLAFELSHRKTHYVNPFASDAGWLYHFASILNY